jgi:Protein of unknown function (DUF2857)
MSSVLDNIIPVHSEYLRTLIFLHVIEKLQRGEFEDLVQSAGIDPMTLDQLRKLRVDDVLRLSKMPHLTIGLTIDPHGLVHAMETLQKLSSEEILLEYFISHGASIPMLRQLFHVDHKVVDFYRSVIGPKRNGGRAHLPNSNVRDAIHASWTRSVQEKDLRRRYQSLHQGFIDFPLDALYAVINEFEE